MKKFLKYRTHDVAFLGRMPAGIPGDVTRKEGAVVQAAVYDATNPPTAYGVPVVADGTSHNVRKMLTATDHASSIMGFLVRPYPTSNPNTTDGLGTSSVNTVFPANVIKSGYFNAILAKGTAVVQGKVYVRTVTVNTDIVGALEAASSITATAGTITGTGTGTLAFAAVEGAVGGTYSLVLQSTSQTAKVTVIDPNGNRLADATVGTAYTAQGVTFTITAAGTMTSGDSFAPTVVYNTEVLPGAFYQGAADATGNVEIAYNV